MALNLSTILKMKSLLLEKSLFLSMVCNGFVFVPTYNKTIAQLTVHLKNTTEVLKQCLDRTYRMLDRNNLAIRRKSFKK